MKESKIMAKKTIHLNRFWLFALVIALFGCTSPKHHILKIAVSKQSEAYSAWLKRNTDTIELINLYPLSLGDASETLEQCDGLLITGGEDVFPGLYGKTYDTLRCGSFDRFRDSLEIMSIAMALEKKMPIMGICRGEQILNVALGGSLIIDIPEDFDTVVVHRQQDYMRCFHSMHSVPGSMLFDLSGAETDSVTSNHHQAIDQLAAGLRICAYAADSLPEAICWENDVDKGFLLAVQWHPERMREGHPFSDPLALAFLQSAQKYRQHLNNCEE